MNTVDALKQAEVFLGLGDEDLQKIAPPPSCRIESFGSGNTVQEPSPLGEC